MNLENVRREIKELKNSIIWKHEPACKVFITGANASFSDEEIQEYKQVHPHTKVIVLYRRSCRNVSTD